MTSIALKGHPLSLSKLLPPTHIPPLPCMFQPPKAADAKFKEIEKVLRIKAANLEEVDDQRKFIEALPNKIGELLGDLEGTKVKEDLRMGDMEGSSVG